MLALAVGYAVYTNGFDASAYFAMLTEACRSNEFREKIWLASKTASREDLAALGNGIAAVDSVPTAIAAVALTPDSYAETIANVILLGGDTDTIAAMAGAISGALLGIDSIPSILVSQLEDSEKGKSYLVELSDRLFERASRGNGRAQ